MSESRSQAVRATAIRPEIIDDKSPHCILFILSRLSLYRAHTPDEPFFIGLNGVQGAGKTTLVSALQATLQKEGLETLVCSIDDLYLTHSDQLALAQQYPDNELVQHRGEPGKMFLPFCILFPFSSLLAGRKEGEGETLTGYFPGTHDMNLARELFAALRTSSPTLIPSYDKSLFSGSGDRLPSSSWTPVNQPSQPKIQVIIFEGWCVGFRALSAAAVEAKYASSLSSPDSTLQKHKLEHLLFVNEKLREYDVMTDTFNAFLHIDAQETGFVYEWRLEQEAQLRREKGMGMSDEQVVRFVDGYYPAYELFTGGVREGVLRGKGREGAQLRLVVGRDRRVVEVVRV
ncbi:Meiotically up-regulated 58 [Hyphodiscus hymeniophilus]|uniref:Meiotically up-regulated 58 n=1 Tax=Hyphodiscus hymeniophilus TaxID=353542 RepID=A0A9P6VJK6_9HELO|nr:Meiotically up-regulated 58 [Hyphodiscus hymeniophilus]